MNILGGKFRWGPGGYENGPSGHDGTSWKTENAWDLITNSNTDVYSITEGVVTKIKSPKTAESHLFGTSIEILGRSDYPTIFYCNLSSVHVRVGSKVQIGEKLGKVAQAPKGGQSFLHVALPFGKRISSLIGSSGDVSGKNSSVSEPSSSKTTSSEPSSNELSLTKILSKPKSYNSKNTSLLGDKSLGDKITSTISKIITPIALGGALLEEVDKIKKLMK